MRGAIDDDQLFRFGNLLKLRANSGEAEPICVGVIARHDEQ